MTIGRWMTLGVLLVLGLAPAGDVARFDTEPVPEPPTDPHVLVLRLREWRSLTPPEELAALPAFALYGGGRVIVSAPAAGALHQGREFTLSPARYRRVHLAAHRAGLARSARLRTPAVMTDGWSLIVTLWSGDRHHTTEVGSPGSWDTGRRQRVASFRKYVMALAGRSTVYQPERLAVLPTFSGSGAESPRRWRWANPRYGADTWFGACTVISRPTMDAVMSEARLASPATPWHDGGEPLHLVFRPMLPHERDCDDLDQP
ncbi:hypothetical protein WEI85_26480 [Actinomycetes bacterium KLBMP 9797]